MICMVINTGNLSQDLGLYINLHLWELRQQREMTDFEVRTEKVQDEPGTSCARVKSHTETNGVTSKGHRGQFEGALTRLRWDIWESRKNNDFNTLNTSQSTIC